MTEGGKPDIAYHMVTVLGPTASSKTSFAAHLAGRTGGEIVNADSRQVYRSMDLGTGKDYRDYFVGKKKIPVHLIDIADPGSEYNVYEYQKDFYRVHRWIRERGKLTVLCGGSGLYIEAVLSDYKLIRVPVDRELREELRDKDMDELIRMLRSMKTLHNRSDTSSRKRLIRAIEIASYYAAHPQDDSSRPGIRNLTLGIKFDRETQRKRITDRLKKRLKQGMIEEVEMLLSRGISPEKLEYYGLEYRYITRYLKDRMTYEEMFRELNTAIHRFAKRQMTWFRRMERKGLIIHWLDGHAPMEEKIDRALRLLAIQHDGS